MKKLSIILFTIFCGSYVFADSTTSGFVGLLKVTTGVPDNERRYDYKMNINMDMITSSMSTLNTTLTSSSDTLNSKINTLRTETVTATDTFRDELNDLPTSYIKNQTTLQNGTTMHITSATIDGFSFWGSTGQGFTLTVNDIHTSSITASTVSAVVGNFNYIIGTSITVKGAGAKAEIDGAVVLQGNVTSYGMFYSTTGFHGNGSRLTDLSTQSISGYVDLAVSTNTKNLFISTGSQTVDSFHLKNTTVTEGTYTNANISVDSDGRILQAASGSSGSSGGGSVVSVYDEGILRGDITSINFVGDDNSTSILGSTLTFFNPKEGLGSSLINKSKYRMTIGTTGATDVDFASSSIHSLRTALTAKQVLGLSGSSTGYCGTILMKSGVYLWDNYSNNDGSVAGSTIPSCVTLAGIKGSSTVIVLSFSSHTLLTVWGNLKNVMIDVANKNYTGSVIIQRGTSTVDVEFLNATNKNVASSGHLIEVNGAWNAFTKVRAANVNTHIFDFNSGRAAPFYARNSNVKFELDIDSITLSEAEGELIGIDNSSYTLRNTRMPLSGTNMFIVGNTSGSLIENSNFWLGHGQPANSGYFFWYNYTAGSQATDTSTNTVVRDILIDLPFANPVTGSICRILQDGGRVVEGIAFHNIRLTCTGARPSNWRFAWIQAGDFMNFHGCIIKNATLITDSGTNTQTVSMGNFIDETLVKLKEFKDLIMEAMSRTWKTIKEVLL